MQDTLRTTSESAEPASPGLFSIFDSLVVLIRGRRFILLMTCIGALIGVVAAVILPPTYTAQAIIMPSQATPYSGLAAQLDGISPISTGLGSLRTPVELYISLVKAPTVERDFIDRFSLKKDYKARTMADAMLVLKKHVDIDGSGKDGLIYLRYSSKSAARSAELANGYVEVFSAFSRRLSSGEANRRKTFFSTQLLAERENLVTAEEQMKKMEQQSGAIEIDAQTRTLIQSAASLRAEIAAKEVEIKALRTYAAPDNPDLIREEQELSGLQGQLSKLSGGDRSDSEDMILPKTTLPQATLEYIRAVREVKYHETLVQMLGKQFESANLDVAKESAAVQIIDLAAVPDKPSSPSKGMKVLIGMASGFLFGCIWLSLRHIYDRIRQSPEMRTHIASLNDALKRS